MSRLFQVLHRGPQAVRKTLQDSQGENLHKHALIKNRCNRQFATLLHDAVFPSGSRLTKATAKLQSLLDGPVVKLILEGTALGVEND